MLILDKQLNIYSNMDNIKFRCITFSKPLPAEMQALQAWWLVRKEFILDATMGTPGQMSIKERLDLLNDEQTARAFLKDYGISFPSIRWKCASPQEFMNQAILEKSHINWETQTIDWYWDEKVSNIAELEAKAIEARKLFPELRITYAPIITVKHHVSTTRFEIFEYPF